MKLKPMMHPWISTQTLCHADVEAAWLHSGLQHAHPSGPDVASTELETSTYQEDSSRHLQLSHLKLLQLRTQQAIAECNACFGCDDMYPSLEQKCQPIRAQSELQPPSQSTASPARISGQDHVHTVVIRNIPYSYTVHELQSEVDGEGFASLYNLLYLPMQKQKQVKNLGYAFVNLLSSEIAVLFRQKFHKRHFQLHADEGFHKVSTVSAANCQGFDANLKRFLTNQKGDLLQVTGLLICPGPLTL